MPVGDWKPPPGYVWNDATGWTPLSLCNPPWINSILVPDYAKELKPGWDGYGGRVPTDEAIETARHMSLVPGGDGSLQFEIHAGGCDVEIHIANDGVIDFVSSSCLHTEVEK